MLLAMDPAFWDGQVGDVMKVEIGRVQPMLPQQEAILNPSIVPISKLNDLLKAHRNIIIVDIADNLRNVETKTVLTRSKWAEGQLIYTIHAKSEEEFIKEFKKNGKAVVDAIIEEERVRLSKYHHIVKDIGLTQELDSLLHIDLTVPKDFVKVKTSKHFASYMRERIVYLSGTGHDVIQGIVVYEWPYYGEQMFTSEYQAALRDSVMQDKVQSDNDSPMIVEPLRPPLGMERNHMNNYAYETRGLWKFESPLMGGPYVSLTLVDQHRGRIITVDGYVFAPKFDKIEYLREMEAIIYSVKF